MYKRTITTCMMAMVACSFAVGMTCEGDGPAGFGVPRWSQFQGDNLKQGFMLGRTTYALEPLIKWELTIDETGFSSPVQGPDGTIYIGTQDGALVAINPDGTEKWTQPLFANSTAFGAPAVADDGNIFFVTSEQIDDGRLFSTLFKISPEGAVLETGLPTTATANASPTIYNDMVFLPAITNGSRAELFVFDMDLNVVLRDDRMNGCTPICSDTPLRDFLGRYWEMLTSCVFPPPCNYDGSGTEYVGRYFDPSVSIYDAGGNEEPIIITATPFCMSAFVFDGPNELRRIWFDAVNGGECDDEALPHSTPAILNAGLVVIGNENGIVRGVDVHTGNELWSYDAGDAVLQPAASFGRQIYVASKEMIHLIDSDGTPLAKYPLTARTNSAPVLSSEFAYVSAFNGIHTFSFDLLSGYTKDGTIAGGYSSPAILDDGSLLVAGEDGTIRAYGTGSLDKAVTYPVVQFDESVTDEPIGYTDAAELLVEVSDPEDGMFEGEVMFVSDRDGPVCTRRGSGNTFTCSTAPLSVGTHVLTAAATNATGGTGTASVTVVISNTPPSIEITAPMPTDELFDHQPITFEAYVFDPDQNPFPQDKIVWTSSIDGNLGTGWTVTKQLTKGAHRITLSASDEMNTATFQIMEIEVRSGEVKPMAEIHSPTNDGLVAPGTTVTFDATVSDPEDGDLPPESIEWISNRDGLLGTGATLDAVLSSDADPCNHTRHTITLRLTDSHGNVTEYTLEVVVGVIC